MNILIYGYGNPGRQDDGLGNAFVDHVEHWAKEQGLTNIAFDSNYQLNIEDAHAIAEKDLTIFVDASVEDLEDWCISKVTESSKQTFTTHAASPGYIVDLCNNIYQKTPPTYLVHIRGFEWDFKEGLTQKAVENLNKALDHIKPLLLDPEALLIKGLNSKKCKN